MGLVDAVHDRVMATGPLLRAAADTQNALIQSTMTGMPRASHRSIVENVARSTILATNPNRCAALTRLAPVVPVTVLVRQSLAIDFSDTR